MMPTKTEAQRRSELQRMSLDDLQEAEVLATGSYSPIADVGKSTSGARTSQIGRIIAGEKNKGLISG
jgi:hypothetical protein